jgi:putative hemolysin
MPRTLTIDGVEVTQDLIEHEEDGGQVIVTSLPDGSEYREWIGWGFRSEAPGGPLVAPNAEQKAQGMAAAANVYNSMSNAEIRRRMAKARQPNQSGATGLGAGRRE